MTIDQSLFIGFVTAMGIIVVAIVGRSLGTRSSMAVGLSLMAWFAIVGGIAHSGVLQKADARPPGMVFILAPVVAYLVVATLMVFARRTQWPLAFPLWLLIGTQTFRVIVELFIHRLWQNGIVPETLTYNGANVDIYIGASAPIVAWLSSRGSNERRIALIWNFFGLLALGNVVTRAILSAPGPLNFLHTDPPNRMFGIFPFMFIPAFFVPIAVTLHLLAIRAILGRDRANTIEATA